MVFIDTEGLLDLENEETHDIRIFMLTLLLSSHTIFNCSKNFNRDLLAKLGFVSKLAHSVAINNLQEEERKEFEEIQNQVW